MSYGGGIAWRHGTKWLVDADVMLQKWGDLKYPAFSTREDAYVKTRGLLKDRWQVNVGADYVPNAMSLTYLKRVHYRLGAGYTTPYYIINGVDGPKDISVSAGFGLPLQNRYNDRSVLNISAQWVRSSAENMITANMFRINIGLTFNERWFFKWKID